MIGSLFSGIGGLELGLERAGLGPVAWQVEISKFCRSILAKHWPEAQRLENVKTTNFRLLPRARVLCGSWPCQPVSVAGKRRAQQDPRWLWPEVARALEEQEPAIFVGENVPGLRTAGLCDVLADFARLGFDAEWSSCSAVLFGAPHVRRRLFVVATHPDRVARRPDPGWLEAAIQAAAAPLDRSLVEGLDPSYTDGARRLEQARSVAEKRGWSKLVGWHLDPAAGMDDGLPARVDGRARKALGNAVVPQIAEVIGRAIAQQVSP